jgi:hypothetical protein
MAEADARRERRTRPVRNVDAERERIITCVRYLLWPLVALLAFFVVLVMVLQVSWVQDRTLRGMGVVRDPNGEGSGLPLSYTTITGLFPMSFIAHNLTLVHNTFTLRTFQTAFEVNARSAFDRALIFDRLVLFQPMTPNLES